MTPPLHLFEGAGVELEYMLVERDTLNVLPAADQILHKVAGNYESDVELGTFAWSNELVLHVIEIKTNGPAPNLYGLAPGFQQQINAINELADDLNACLLPTAMHPWMNPLTETKLWPHEFSPVYHAFNRIFSCQGHGWSNLQSTHLNLPFCGDDEFSRLHAAIRLILPLIPAIAASSPICDGRPAINLDARLAHYRTNATRVPQVAGAIIPEQACSQNEYHQRILSPLYRAIAPHDPDGILQYEWLNARGAIARFDRGAIEIRLLDIQECAQADLAILQLLVAAIHALVDEQWATYDTQRHWPLQPLADLLTAAIRDADQTALQDDPAYVELFGADPRLIRTMADLWRHLLEQTAAVEPPRPTRPASTGQPPPAGEGEALDVIFNRGPLARRIAQAAGPDPDRERLHDIYRRLAHCLATGQMFIP